MTVLAAAAIILARGIVTGLYVGQYTVPKNGKTMVFYAQFSLDMRTMYHKTRLIIKLIVCLMMWTFIAIALGSNYVIVSNSGRYFQLEDGTDFIPLGFDQMPDFPESLFQIYPINNLEYRKEDLREYFNMMHDHGVNVIRVWGEAPDVDYRYMLLENPIGVFNPAFQRFFDDLFELAEDCKIYILLTPYDTCWQYNKWDTYPYNSENGGPCDSKHNGLTPDECFEYQKARMKWFVDRYGNSDYLFAWDIMNEIEIWWGDGVSESDILEWTNRMTSWLIQYERQTWGKNHLITLNTAGCPTSGDLRYAIFRHPNVDFATNHMYYSDIADPPDAIAPAVTVNYWVKTALNQFDTRDMRPFFDSESGPIDGELPEAFDNIYYHNMIWAHLASGGAGSNLRWPFRLFVGPTDGMFDSVLAMSRIIKHIKWSQFASENIDSDVSVTNTGSHTVIDMACGDSYTALVFILKDSRYSTGNISGADLTVSNMTAGTYLSKCFDSYTGDIISEEEIEAVSGNVDMDLPDFKEDIVVIIVNQDAWPTINRKPDAWITSPPAITGTGQVNSVTLSADANCANDANVSYLEFWANYDNGYGQGWRLLNTDYTAPYSYEWDISSLSDQAVEFRVDVYDSKGVSRVTAKAMLGDGGVMLERSVGDVTDGYGSIEYPPVNATIDTSQPVTLKARAWDISSDVERVKFWVKGTPSNPGGSNTLLGEVTTPTSGVYTLTVDMSSYTDSSRWISLDVVDNNGNTSAPADIHDVTLDSTPSDTAEPTAILTSPECGDVITSGPVTVSANASDDISGVDRVEFWANYDGGWNYLGSDSTEPYSITWSGVLSSSQMLTFTADVFDNVGNSVAPASAVSGIYYESASQGDTFDPWCHIYYPDVYTSITRPVTLKAIAGDRGSSGVSSVTFKYYWNSQWNTIGSDSTEPHECVWDVEGLPIGSTTQIRVDVNDYEGNFETSADVHYGIKISSVSDINGDDSVNSADLSILVEQWLQSPGIPSSDIAPQPNGDDLVNFLDFALLALDWLK